MERIVPPNASFVPPCGYRSSWSWPDDDEDFAEHVRWFAENLSIVSEDDNILPLKLSPEQTALEFYKYQCRREDKPCWILILKARKLGCSTWSCGTFFRDGLEQGNLRSYTMAHDDDSTSILFEMTKNFHDFLTDPPELETASAKELKLAHNSSSFRVRTAGAGGRAGRAGTFTRVHLSEVDRYPDPHGLYGAVVNSVPESTAVVIVVESTAEGPGLLMDELWQMALDRRNEFMPFFFPWWESKLDKYKREPTWNDLRSYAPTDWLVKNKKFVDECEEAHLLSLASEIERGGIKHGRVGKSGYTGKLRLPGGHGLQADESGGPRQGSQESGREDEESSRRHSSADAARGEDEEAGDDPGGHLPGSPVERESCDSDGRYAPHGVGSQLPEAGGGGDGPDGIVGDELGSVGLDPDFPGRFSAEGTGDGRVRGPGGVRAFNLETVFKESLTEYEKALIEKESISLTQVNWLRYCLWHRCKGDDDRRKREFPSFPEEPFEAAGSDILDARVLAKWMRERNEIPILGRGSMRAEIDQLSQSVKKVWWDGDDRTGKIEVYEWPNPKCRYVMAIDTSQGNQDGDWIVGFVLNAETGDQAAEFRAKMDPDLCVDQLEYLALWFKASTQRSALVMIEMNAGFGGPFMRHFADRQTCDIYEREQLDRITKNLTKRHGWMTSVQTRPQMIAELKYATRTESWKIRSIETLREAKSLWESPVGKVEARPNCHDDGIMSGAIALMGRNWLIGIETAEKEKDRKDKSPIHQFTKSLRKIEREERKSAIHKIKAPLPVKSKVVYRKRVHRDGRRSRI